MNIVPTHFLRFFFQRSENYNLSFTLLETAHLMRLEILFSLNDLKLIFAV